ncbi:class I glutamine amidotransferase-like protein [Crassisporium funariophilum]|nr:class I glutamine amidotransferase-like protein [Crassisporium funariophilum]
MSILACAWWTVSALPFLRSSSISPMSTTRIALLVCGGLTGKPLALNGNYYDIFLRYLQASKPNPQTSFTLDPYDVVHEMTYPNEDDYDSIMLTGSAASAYENIEWTNKLVGYISRVADTKPHVKLIGICFGHQIVARALGGECVPNGGRWEVGPTPIELTDIGKQLFGNHDTLNIQQMHRDHVPSVPLNFHLLASSPVSLNQGMVRFASLSNPMPGKPLPPIQILTVQGHPEFTESVVSAIVEQRFSSGVIDAEVAADAERRKLWKNDGVDAIGKVVWKVIMQTLM